jgi:hypothetical protein
VMLRVTCIWICGKWWIRLDFCQYIREIFSSILMCDVIFWIRSCIFDTYAWGLRYCASIAFFFVVPKRHVVCCGKCCVHQSSGFSIAECSFAKYKEFLISSGYRQHIPLQESNAIAPRGGLQLCIIVCIIVAIFLRAVRMCN